MLLDVHKLIKEMVNPIEEQDIHIHVGGSSSTTSQSSGQGQNNDSNSQQQSSNTQQSTGSQSGNQAAQLLKKQLQNNQQQGGSQQSVSGNTQQGQGPSMAPTSVHPIQHQNNVHHVGQMMQQHRAKLNGGQANQQQQGPIKFTKPRFNEATKREMKEIYVKDHIRRIGRRPTAQDVQRKFNGM